MIGFESLGPPFSGIILNFFFNYDKCNLTGYVIDLFLKDRQFESYKFQSHWRLTWSLPSGPVGLVEVRTT
jgi:hypothetical protein